jgi:hypothetical protein
MPTQERSLTVRAPRVEGDAADARIVANMSAKLCCWSWPWRDAVEKIGRAGAAESGAAEGSGQQKQSAVPNQPAVSKLQHASAARRARRGAVFDEHDGGAVSLVARVLGHGPCDLQAATAALLPVACAPPSLRRVVAEGDETVCFFMVWSGSMSDRWHDEVTCDV